MLFKRRSYLRLAGSGSIVSRLRKNAKGFSSTLPHPKPQTVEPAAQNVAAHETDDGEPRADGEVAAQGDVNAEPRENGNLGDDGYGVADHHVCHRFDGRLNTRLKQGWRPFCKAPHGGDLTERQPVPHPQKWGCQAPTVRLCG